MKNLWLLLPLIFLAGCSKTLVSEPALVQLPNGKTLRGTTEASLSKGTFSVSDNAAKLTCSGTYDPLDTNKQITAAVSCNDGRTGTVSITRDDTGLGGTGTATLSDGTTATASFGAPARKAIANLQGQ